MELQDAQMPDLDIWGVNEYTGESFYLLYANYATQSKKPLWISEFGIDAFSTTSIAGINAWGSTAASDLGGAGAYDPNDQAAWDTNLWNEIFNNAPVTIGGTLMEYSDEWYKPYEFYCTSPADTQVENASSTTICNSTHKYYGFIQAVFPDQFTNEEWYGMMGISVNPVAGGPDVISPRPVYNNLEAQWLANPWPSLTLNITGLGAGTITSTPALGGSAGLNCAFASSSGTGTCSSAFTSNQPVTLSFSSNNNSTVTNWGVSGCTGGSPTCSITPDTAITLNVTVSAPAGSPTITTQPASVTVSAPARGTFTVVATGSPAPTYQWYIAAPGSNSFAAIGGANSASYTSGTTTLANNGLRYECVVRNSVGSITSNPATLTVIAATAAPTITSQPANAAVIQPATATFTVVASGNPTPTYQWMQETPGATSYTAIGGATSASYTTPTTTLASSGTKYECVVTNSLGSVTSNAATLTVAIPVGIAIQPASVTVSAPATATFTVVATGTPAPTYQWYIAAPGSNSFAAISGATSASYTSGTTTLANSGLRYECIVSNVAGSITSNAATLTVIAATTAPTITTQPANAAVIQPATATFTVAASGTPTLIYQWMQETPGATSYTAIGGATSASYTTPTTTLANSGTKYECVVTNSLGSVTSNAATLTIAIPVGIVSQPLSATVIAPATATFTVVATGTPAPTYQWYIAAPGSNSFAAINGATSASYTSGTTTLANSGIKYECIVSNAAGSITSNAATLTVNAATAAPIITTQPANATVIQPATATFTVVASGNPTPTYQWMQEAPGATSYTAISGATSASYTTPTTTISNSGTKYECVVTNSVGSVTSNAVTLTVNAAAVAPTITTQPVSATVIAPATATFTVVATGSPAPTYQW